MSGAANNLTTTLDQATARSSSVAAGGDDTHSDSSHQVKPTDEKDLGQRLGDAHMNILPTKKLILTMSIMSFNLFTAFADQTAITIALPTLADDLNAEKTINWAGTASLLANCAFQVLFGRLADIFGRKDVLLYSMLVLASADLACGFAQTGVQFYIFRAFAGIGTGGMQALTIVLISDIVTLKQRGKYQGILGANVGMGNAVGPFLMSAFIKHSSWRNFYHMMPCLIVFQCATTYFFIDNTKQHLKSVLTKKEKFKNIDYSGIFFSTAGLTLILVPLNGGGSIYAWNSLVVILMFVFGGLCFLTFFVIEWKNPRLPMIPLTLFKSPSLNIIFSSNFLYGMTFFSFQYYIPYYLQIVSGHDELQSAILLLSLVLVQAFMSTVAGQIISRSGHYKYVILAGYGTWLLSLGLLLIFNVHTSSGTIAGVFVVMGCGVGFTFQPSVVAAQAQARKSERAVVISTRNFVRYFGAALGVAIASLIVTNSLLHEISRAMSDPDSYNNIPVEYLNYLKEHIYNKVEIKGLNDQQVLAVRIMYSKALKNYFYFTIPLMAYCFISTIFMKDRGLQCIDELPESKEKDKV